MAVSLTETVTLPPIDSFHERLKSQSTSSVAFRSINSSRTLRNGDKPSASDAPNGAVMRVRIDPHRALQPARKKLSTLEAQRIMAVLSTVIRRAELASALPHLAAAQRTNRDQNIAFGSELSRLIETNGVVIDSYNELSGIPSIDALRNEGARSQSIRESSAVSHVTNGSRNSSRPATGSATGLSVQDARSRSTGIRGGSAVSRETVSVLGTNSVSRGGSGLSRVGSANVASSRPPTTSVVPRIPSAKSQQSADIHADNVEDVRDPSPSSQLGLQTLVNYRFVQRSTSMAFTSLRY